MLGRAAAEERSDTQWSWILWDVRMLAVEISMLCRTVVDGTDWLPASAHQSVQLDRQYTKALFQADAGTVQLLLSIVTHFRCQWQVRITAEGAEVWLSSKHPSARTPIAIVLLRTAQWSECDTTAVTCL